MITTFLGGKLGCLGEGGESFHPSNHLDETLSGSDTFLCDLRIPIQSANILKQLSYLERLCFGYVNLEKELSY